MSLATLATFATFAKVYQKLSYIVNRLMYYLSELYIRCILYQSYIFDIFCIKVNYSMYYVKVYDCFWLAFANVYDCFWLAFAKATISNNNRHMDMPSEIAHNI
jgi:hypothetical protein